HTRGGPVDVDASHGWYLLSGQMKSRTTSANLSAFDRGGGSPFDPWVGSGRGVVGAFRRDSRTSAFADSSSSLSPVRNSTRSAGTPFASATAFLVFWRDS